jgi:hypothetical protein
VISVPEWRSVARYGLPGLILGLGVAWSFGAGPGPTAQAQPGTPGTEANGTIAFTSTTANNPNQLLYLIDTKNQSFAIYRVEPSNSSRGSGSVKLEAARKYRWDLMLSEYNNVAPEVRAVESMVKSVGSPRN